MTESRKKRQTGCCCCCWDTNARKAQIKPVMSMTSDEQKWVKRGGKGCQESEDYQRKAKGKSNKKAKKEQQWDTRLERQQQQQKFSFPPQSIKQLMKCHSATVLGGKIKEKILKRKWPEGENERVMRPLFHRSGGPSLRREEKADEAQAG